MQPRMSDVPKPPRARKEWKGQEIDWTFLMKALPRGALARGIDQAAKRSRQANAARLRRGCLPGTGDTYIFYRGITLWLERKAGADGRLGPGQAEFRNAVLANGGHWALVQCTKEVEAACLAAGIPLRATLGDIRTRIEEQTARLPAKPKRAARKPTQPRFGMTVARAHRRGMWK
jgi:hypothetical protein